MCIFYIDNFESHELEGELTTLRASEARTCCGLYIYCIYFIYIRLNYDREGELTTLRLQKQEHVVAYINICNLYI